ncbi:MAG TPA: 16S rRNA (uracil(1498)-N(3))-methyltransferase [Marinilabiliales bacterium]|jgi:16S rRNA (uracil1498-N3)-methyltransferase|nr:MAG: 16S rRNA (uracil(1498)-N(3))-methyltransferase [Bacteroidetes bacterium GWA2_40_14]OFX61226.1 MAG: 16S rRNA (uracil(1498)-N(3))-methyltransferase [Bacteroidetes bacterium GWC2_40_13]OFX75240.1 MAG: 16S rRNA (uracil(1498)-N(3))-methyltransferase [Bacteroidetes bacterium GWD2_40_43]OFX89837.1 MAG: 16S rRNA (uracil(1498)-N(3))-methyltransferase [Bacteroidetes bacterium GWE2_40_63]OFY21970.1 MAG: 16S rRNA (uracil(1498)-N(3))-methyltransferase [Bacteroidetes bacterium GWF2_40_13]OFZ30317.1 
MQVFYTPDIKKITYTLDAEESKHAVKVLRMHAGDEICMIDGVGGLYYGIIDEPDAKKCTIRVIEKIEQYGRKNYSLHLAFAPTKTNERTEWLLEKITEIGIDEITPLLCQRSERKNINKERMEKIILSAMKQSIKAYMPVMNDMATFKEFVSSPREGGKMIAHCMDNPKPPLKSKLACHQKITILIGPEGDFSPEEVELAKQYGYEEVHLGKSRLRTETAGIVACHTVNVIKDE